MDHSGVFSMKKCFWCVKFFLGRKFFFLPTDPKFFQNVIWNDNIFLSRLRKNMVYWSRMALLESLWFFNVSSKNKNYYNKASVYSLTGRILIYHVNVISTQAQLLLSVSQNILNKMLCNHGVRFHILQKLDPF